MPNLDRTGPQGQGAKTGRGQGKCDSDPQTEEGGMQTFGRGLGRGFGRGFGRGLRGLGRAFRRGWGRRSGPGR